MTHLRSHFLAGLALLGLLEGAAVARAGEQRPSSDPGQSAAIEAQPADDDAKENGFEDLWNVPTIYRGEDGGALDELRIVGRLHLDNYVVESDVGDASDLVVRRARLGARARLLDNLEAHVETELDLEGGPLYSRLTDAYLAWRFSDVAQVKVGKHSVKFTLDGATSSNELLTIDRSNVANNFWFTDEYIPGVSVSGRSGAWSYNTGVFSGGRSNSEFGDFDGGYFWLGSLGRDFAQPLGVKKALLRADYVYNEPDADSDFTRSFQHIGSLAFVLEAEGWGVSGDLVAGDGFLGQSDAIGVTVLPWMDLTDRLQLAGRYTYLNSDEANGLRLARYENAATSGRGDRYHELYAGLNYYIFGHRLKAQTGLTYANMHDRANDGGAYDGWTWTTALRMSW